MGLGRESSSKGCASAKETCHADSDHDLLIMLASTESGQARSTIAYQPGGSEWLISSSVM